MCAVRPAGIGKVDALIVPLASDGSTASGLPRNVKTIVDRIAKGIGPKTRAVGVTWVHSSTGVKIPVEEISAVVARANRGRAVADRCLLIVDGVITILVGLYGWAVEPSAEPG